MGSIYVCNLPEWLLLDRQVSHQLEKHGTIICHQGVLYCVFGNQGVLTPDIVQVISKLCVSWVSHLAVVEEQTRIVAKFVLERLRQRLRVYHDSLKCKVGIKSTTGNSSVLRSSNSRLCGHLDYAVCVAPLVLPFCYDAIHFAQDQIVHVNSFVNVNNVRCNVHRADVENFRVLCDRFPAQDTSGYEEPKFNCKKYIYGYMHR